MKVVPERPARGRTGCGRGSRSTPDGRLIVTSGNVLRVFAIDPATWLARACVKRDVC